MKQTFLFKTLIALCAVAISGAAIAKQNDKNDKPSNHSNNSFSGFNWDDHGKKDDASRDSFNRNAGHHVDFPIFELPKIGMQMRGHEDHNQHGFDSHRDDDHPFKHIDFDHLNVITGGQHGHDFSFGLPCNTIPAVPEPQTYVMMLAGMALMTFVARCRKQQANW